MAELLREGPGLYGYVGGNPVNRRDRLGLFSGAPGLYDEGFFNASSLSGPGAFFKGAGSYFRGIYRYGRQAGRRSGLMGSEHRRRSRCEGEAKGVRPK